MCQLTSRKMAENLAEMEENNAEVRQVTCRKMDDMEEKAA